MSHVMQVPTTLPTVFAKAAGMIRLDSCKQARVPDPRLGIPPVTCLEIRMQVCPADHIRAPALRPASCPRSTGSKRPRHVLGPCHAAADGSRSQDQVMRDAERRWESQVQLQFTTGPYALGSLCTSVNHQLPALGVATTIGT